MATKTTTDNNPAVAAPAAAENSKGGVENPRKTVDLNSTEPDHAEDATSAAESDGGLTADGEKKKEGGGEAVTKAATVSTVAGDNAPVNDIQKKIRRAERFGLPVQLSEEERRNSRAERFGTATALNESEASKKSEELKRKARAERFGLPMSSAPDDQEAKKKARLGRFGGADKKPDSAEEEKRKARALRFSKPVSNSSSQVNGKGNTGQEGAVAEKVV